MKPAERNKLFCRLTDDWNEGRAPWLYDSRDNLAVRTWAAAEREVGVDAADEAIRALVRDKVASRRIA